MGIEVVYCWGWCFVVVCVLEKVGVVLLYCLGEGGCEIDLGQIGQQQCVGQWLYLLEGGECGGDEGQQQQDFGEGQGVVVLVEEQLGLQCIGCQLDDE